jgi:hypothetical protein
MRKVCPSYTEERRKKKKKRSKKKPKGGVDDELYSLRLLYCMTVVAANNDGGFPTYVYSRTCLFTVERLFKSSKRRNE